VSDQPDGTSNEMGWPVNQVVRECLEGSEEAWSALVDRYTGLIFSVPIRFGLQPDGASEVFQEVCLSLLIELPNLREPKALPAWLIRTAWHKSIRWKRLQGRYVELEPAVTPESIIDTLPVPEELVEEIESQQALYEVLAELPARCYRLIQMLFFETPPVPYQQIAERLGLAIGSIGFTRMRCLKQLRKRLLERGFR
jgi:RNA polymerase sigma factor (sigma-70 family)